MATKNTEVKVMEKGIGMTEELRMAVAEIKRAIVVSQGRALRMISGQQLSLYYGIGVYVSERSRNADWGTSAIDNISTRLQREMPGLRGFSAQSIRNMRTFAEFWSQYIKCSSVTSEISRDEFLSISFTHHMEILHKTKETPLVQHHHGFSTGSGTLALYAG